MQLKFSKIQNKTIFKTGFENLQDNNVIEFKRMGIAGCGIAVIYAPNGVGKSSLAEVLRDETGGGDISFEATDESGNIISPTSHAFKVIADQINRNIIPGETADYLIGDDIQREYRLRDQVNRGFMKAFETVVPDALKKDYKITKIGDFLLSILQFRDEKAYEYLKNIVNKRRRGKDIDRSEFLSYIRDDENRPVLYEADPDKRSYIIANPSAVQKLLSVDLTRITGNAGAEQIERNDDAIKILLKYKNLHTCIVCDNEDIDSEALMNQKTEGRKHIYNSLDVATKELFDQIVMESSLQNCDPFHIKPIVMNFISTGIVDSMLMLRAELQHYVG
ncbi:MAG: ATP-binding protein [Bacteroides fragilis]|nr:ATP-binding protein [Bacteroides fragilis]